MVTETRVSLDAFLALPEEEPALEFIDGEVVQKTPPDFHHGTLQSEFVGVIRGAEFARGYAAVTEVRFVFGDPPRAYVPDVSVVLLGRVPVNDEGKFERQLQMAPDIAIEVLSPDHHTGRVLEKLAFYMKHGVRLAIVVDPDLERVSVHRPGAEPELLAAPETLDLGPVIPGLRVDLEHLFSRLRPEANEKPA